MAVSAATLDFTNVKDGAQFNKKHYPDGDYPAVVTKVQDATKKDDKTKKMWLFTIKVQSGVYPYYCGFEENQLWKIRNLLVAAGLNVPKKRVKVDPTKVVGRKIAVTLEEEEYDGKMQSNIGSVFPLSELDGDDDEPETEDADEEEEAEAPEPEEEEEEEEDEEEAPPPPKKASAKKAAPKQEVTDEDLEELEIEEI